MIAETGQIALLIAATFALLQAVLGFSALRPGGEPLLRAVRPVAIVQAAMTVTAFAMLLLVFSRTDLSVKLVAEDSATTLPLLYRVTGAWGNHEGSMLMWITILALAGAAVAIFERRLPERTLAATIGAQGVIALGFFAFLLFSSNPFERLPIPPAEGSGFNPLLQDPGLAFHPPTLYVGYVGLSVAFSFAVGALLTRDVGPAFARAMRPWVLGAWIFLTLGITAGSYWAYYELGWGGWWFWDPTENASLMPWLAATALLHSVSVLATRDGLRAWTVMLAVVAFSMSMVGTFLVRSGILTSVHAFALDPRRGAFILILLALYIGGALALFGARIATVKEGNRFDPVSREGALGGEQFAAVGDPGRGADRDALSAARRERDGREAVGRTALFQRRRGASGPDPGRDHGGGADDALAARSAGRGRQAGRDPGGDCCRRAGRSAGCAARHAHPAAARAGVRSRDRGGERRAAVEAQSAPVRRCSPTAWWSRISASR